VGAATGVGYSAGRKNDNEALDLAGIVMDGLITVAAWIVGLFWAIGAGIGRIFSWGKKREKDVEQGIAVGAHA